MEAREREKRTNFVKGAATDFALGLDPAHAAALACPECRSPFNLFADSLRCTGCGKSFAVRAGFPDFVGEGDLDWGELDGAEMHALIERARQSGWHVPLLELGAKDPFLAYYILDRSRAGWVMHCLKLVGNDVCIDLGSGWGNIAFTLGDWYKTVWSVETVLKRVELQSLRRQQEGKRNVHPIRSGLLKLPFVNETADLVACNGVLEWVGLSHFTQPVRDLQLQFLSEAFRVLKPGGCLYIGIENRYSFLSFLGAKDHSGMRFTNLLPRPLADAVVRQFRPRAGALVTSYRSQTNWPDYRTYTYSYWGYRRLLLKAGFTHVDSCWVWPNYNAPHYSGRFSDDSLEFLANTLLPSSRNRWTRSGAFALSLLPPLLRRALAEALWPGFLLFAFKGEPDRRLRDELEAAGASGLVLLTTTRISAPKQSFFVLSQGKLATAIDVRVSGMRHAPPQSVETQHEIRQVGDFAVACRAGIEGRPLMPEHPRHATIAMEWLIRFQEQTADGSLTESIWQDEIRRALDFLSRQELADRLIPIAVEIFTRIGDLVAHDKLSVTAEHGDFQFRNGIVDRQGKLHMVDWDDYRPTGNPLFDVGTYLLTMAGGRMTDLAQMVRGTGKLGPACTAAFESYTKATALRAASRDTLIAYSLLRLLQRDTIIDCRNGKSIAYAYPGACRLMLQSLSALPTYAAAVSAESSGANA